MNERPPTPPATESVDALLEALIDQLPEGLRDLHEERIGDMGDAEAVAYMEKLLADRSQALSATADTEEIRRKLGERYVSPESPMHKGMSRLIEQMLAHPEYNVGSGLTAEVVGAEEFSGSCFKVMQEATYRDKDQVSSPATEIILLSELDGFEHAGVRTPHIEGYAYIGGYHVIRMERIDGITIRKIIEHKLPLPEGFDPDQFFAVTREYITALHERGVYHRDLHAGNLMVDFSSGAPRVIDMGKSRKTIDPDTDPYVVLDRQGEALMRLTDDFAYLRDVESELRTYMNGLKSKVSGDI